MENNFQNHEVEVGSVGLNPKSEIRNPKSEIRNFGAGAGWKSERGWMGSELRSSWAGVVRRVVGERLHCGYSFFIEHP